MKINKFIINDKLRLSDDVKKIYIMNVKEMKNII